MSTALRLRDLDTPAAVDELVEAFYARVLADPLLAPVFLEATDVDIHAHLPVIKAYWRKMLLGECSYARNMVARHEAVHARVPLEHRHFERWLSLFEATLEARFSGPYARRARRLARTIAGNLEAWLHSPRAVHRLGRY